MGRENCLAYTMNAEMTPTVISPLMANIPPKAAMNTKPMLLMAFSMGPTAPAEMLAFTLALVISSEVLVNCFVTISWRL